MRTFFSTLIQSLIDLIFPQYCEACSQTLYGNENFLCTDCRVNLPRFQSDSHLTAIVRQRISHLNYIESVNCFLIFSKRGKVQRLIHGLKYRKKFETGLQLGRMYAQELISASQLPVADLISTIPLHPAKRRKRGFNQCDAFAQGFSEVSGIPWSGDLLIRTKNTASQTGKTKSERKLNVSGIFTLNQEPRYNSILLLDDIITTGATLESAAEVLFGAGVKKIHIMTIAATLD